LTANKKLKWGVLGCAKIATGQVIPGFQESELNDVVAIASRDLDKAQQTAQQLGIQKAYGSYEALLADDSIDAVYVPLPNHLHMEWTIRAAEAGKHVLCEKPAALNAEQTERMVEACALAGVKFEEAFMYRHSPRYRQIRDILSSGEIGTIRGIHTNFTFNSSGNTGNVRFRKEWGGGALYDIGCYSINGARLLLGQEPEAATVHAFFSPDHDDVDMMASGLLEFPGGVGVTFDCGMWAAFRNTMTVIGTDGLLELPAAYKPSPGNSSSNIIVTARGERREIEVAYTNDYSSQADDFARAVLGGTELPFAPADAINNMRVLDACLRSARERTRITL
jgi:xylose dehydrogenase (NAD/NADP)